TAVPDPGGEGTMIDQRRRCRTLVGGVVMDDRDYHLLFAPMSTITAELVEENPYAAPQTEATNERHWIQRVPVSLLIAINVLTVAAICFVWGAMGRLGWWGIVALTGTAFSLFGNL